MKFNMKFTYNIFSIKVNFNKLKLMEKPKNLNILIIKLFEQFRSFFYKPKIYIINANFCQRCV